MCDMDGNILGKLFKGILPSAKLPMSTVSPMSQAVKKIQSIRETSEFFSKWSA